MKSFVAPCAHLSTYYRELKSFPTDKVLVMPSNPETFVSVQFMELIGKNLNEIIENIKVSDDVNHFNRLRCEQTAFDSSSPILVHWKFQGRLFVFQFRIRYLMQYDSYSPFFVNYELHQMWEIDGTLKELLNMTGVDYMTYKEITKNMQDYKSDFILIKSV